MYRWQDEHADCCSNVGCQRIGLGQPIHTIQSSVPVGTGRHPMGQQRWRGRVERRWGRGVKVGESRKVWMETVRWPDWQGQLLPYPIPFPSSDFLTKGCSEFSDFAGAGLSNSIMAAGTYPKRRGWMNVPFLWGDLQEPLFSSWMHQSQHQHHCITVWGSGCAWGPLGVCAEVHNCGMALVSLVWCFWWQIVRFSTMSPG